MFRRLNNRRAIKADAGVLYFEILYRARHPGLYQHIGVADTLDGRFEMTIVHVVMLLRRLKQLDESEIAQSVIDTMFEDMDQALRELGVSDVKVAKRIKPMAEAFQGRAAAYNAALDAAGDGAALTEALARNVFPDDDGGATSEALAGYIRRLESCLSGRAIADLKAGNVAWPEPVEQP